MGRLRITLSPTAMANNYPCGTFRQLLLKYSETCELASMYNMFPLALHYT